MTRVLFVAAMGGLGGPVRRLATLLSNLKDVERVLIKPESRLLDARLATLGAVDEHHPVRRSAQRNRFGAAAIAWAVLRRCMDRRAPIHVIHANGLVEFALSWPAAIICRVPVVTWVGNYEPPRFVQRCRWIFRRVARRTKWNAVSGFAANVIVECGLAQRDDVRVVTNIVDPDDIAPPPDLATANSRPKNDSAVTVGYLQVARWEKGFDLVPRTISALSDLRGRVRFLIIGAKNDHPGWDELLGLPSELVEIRPRTAQVGEIYAACDVVFSPSRRESFNRVVAEAMMSGTPVVASDLAPVREVVGDGGLLFRCGDVEDAARQLRRMVIDPDLRRTCAQRGRARSAAWHPEPVAATFADLYRSTRIHPVR